MKFYRSNSDIPTEIEFEFLGLALLNLPEQSIQNNQYIFLVLWLIIVTLEAKLDPQGAERQTLVP
jgi:hypothetical protein